MILKKFTGSLTVGMVQMDGQSVKILVQQSPRAMVGTAVRGLPLTFINYPRKHWGHMDPRLSGRELGMAPRKKHFTP